jgi:1-acyl-sn-glycerol-3-phosphate acyltransferase
MDERGSQVPAGKRRRRAEDFARWPRSWPVGYFRQAVQVAGLFPLLWLGYGIEVRGRVRALRIAKPCLIISNHNMHLDWSMVLRALPRPVRRRTAIAAAATDIFGNPLRAVPAQLLANAFPFDKEGTGIRESLEHVTGLLGGGWNVLLLPEGKLTVGETTQPFKSGIGWLAVKSGVDVLPIRIDVLRPGIFEGRWLPWPRGSVRVNIGAPLSIPPGADYKEVAELLEQAVRDA